MKERGLVSSKLRWLQYGQGWVVGYESIVRLGYESSVKPPEDMPEDWYQGCYAGKDRRRLNDSTYRRNQRRLDRTSGRQKQRVFPI